MQFCIKRFNLWCKFLTNLSNLNFGGRMDLNLKLDIYTQLAPIIDEIAHELGRPEEASKWKKLLSDNFYDTLSSIRNKSSREWLTTGVPLRVLNELRKREKATENLSNILEGPTSPRSPRELNVKEVVDQSFKDLTKFIKPPTQEDKKRSTGGTTLRRFLNKRSTVHFKHRATVNIIGRAGHQSLLIKKFMESKPFDKDCRAYLAEVFLFSL